MGFGGNNGLTDFKDILGFNVQARARRARRCSSLSALALALGYLICRGDRHVEARQGADRDPRRREPHALPRLPRRALQAVRLHALGRAWPGVAGALYVPQVGIINPSEFAPANSIEAVIWVAVGGRGTLIGAVARRGPRQLRQDRASPAACSRRTGCSRSAACSSLVTLFLPQGHRRHCSAAGGPRREAARATAAGAGARRSRRSERHDRTAMTRRRHRTCSISTASRVSFDGFTALNNLSLVLEPGEMRAIIGPNGAGKTTMMDVITGKTRPDDGDVLFDGGIDLTQARRGRDRRARHRPQVPEADRVREPHGRGQPRCWR